MKKIFIPLFIIFGCYTSQAQTSISTTLPAVVPLSPNAAEFAKYGNIPVNASTGTPNISIPIYEINTGKIKVPISLSYHASGIQVSQKATWVGLGWSLNAGGVISRSIRGLPDEATNGWMTQQNTRQNILNAISSSDQSALIANYTLLSSFADNAADVDPDFFSYSTTSVSGRFFYSQTTSSFQTIPVEPVKITRITAGAGAYIDNTYQITDVDGTNYYYQVKQTYFNDTQIPVQNYTQSWYLSKIVSADTKDTVQFNYTTATTIGGSSEEDSETEVHTYTTGYDNLQYADKGSQINQNVFYHSYVALQEIDFRGGKVTFNASTPRRDYLGCMLDSITVYSKNGNTYNPIYQYKLNYDYFTTAQPQSDQFDYRLRLLSISKTPVVANGTTQTHQFFYNTTPLPSINAQSMDYWGFYNGSPFNNGYLPHILPGSPDLTTLAQANQYIGGANRDESDAYIQAGMLQKIIYPTGGYTVFNFEPHQYTSDQTQTSTSTITQASLSGVSKTTLSTSNTTFTWPANVTANTGTMALSFSTNNFPGVADPAQQIKLTDLTANTVISTWTHQGDNGIAYNTSVQLTFVPAHSYQVQLLVEGTPPVSVSFSLTGQINQTTSTTKKGGGLRIASMQNFDNNNALLSTEQYTYSGINIGKNDAAIANNYSKVQYRLLDQGASTGQSGSCLYQTYYSIYYYGTAGYGGQNFEGANVVYGDVVKVNYDGNNKPNGKTEFTYNTDRAFSTVFNPTAPSGFEFIDNSEGRTSLPTSEAYYKSNTDGSYSPLKSKTYTYGGPAFFTEPLERVYRSHINTPGNWYCDEPLQDAFTPYNYSILIGASKLTSVAETDYDQSGPIITTATNYSYDNPQHMQVTKITTTGSDGQTILTQNKYPADYTDNTYGSNLLRSQFINNALLEQTVTKNSALVTKVAANYTTFQGSILPGYIMKALTNGTLETRLTYDSYDYWGNILQVAKSGGPKIAYQWGYIGQYPVAQAANATNNDIFYDSFEEGDGKSAAGIAKTGHYSYSGTYTHTFSGLDAGNYILSYWLRSPTLGTWSLVSTTVSAGTTYTIPSITGQIDDVRFYPAGAQMTTYTYDPLIGMTSSTDAKNETAYYEYDSFQRLMNIKDKDGNIIKHTDYHYQGQ